MICKSRQTSSSTVLVIGPPSTMVGGMASVVAQNLSLVCDGRYNLEHFPITVSPGSGEGIIRRVVRHVRQLHRLNAAIRSRRARIVHIHTCSGATFYRSLMDMAIAQCLGSHTVLHVHGAAFDDFHARGTWLRRRIITWALTRADRVVALSDGWRRKLRRMAPGAHITVVENAVEAPSSVIPRQPSATCRFLLLARMDEWKGIDDLLEACAILHAEGTAYELVLAGPEGTAGDKAALEGKIHARVLDGAVRYVGPVHGEEKARLLLWADVYLQPSHNEGMPLSMLEALAHGLPVVATTVGAVPEVIENRRQGILVAPHDPPQLARAMQTLATDRMLRENLSRGGRALFEGRFSLRRLHGDLLSLYDEVLHEHIVVTASQGSRQPKLVSGEPAIGPLDPV